MEVVGLVSCSPWTHSSRYLCEFKALLYPTGVATYLVKHNHWQTNYESPNGEMVVAAA